jgi:hypothetical protein
MRNRKIGRKPDRKRGGGSKRRRSSQPTKRRRSRGRHAAARGELIKLPLLNLSPPAEGPLVCRFHEGKLSGNQSCVDGIECAAVDRARTLEHRVRAIWGLADGAYDGAVTGSNGVRAVPGPRLMSFAAAFETIRVLARSINDDLMQVVSPDKRLNQPSLQFLGSLGLIGEWEKSNSRLHLLKAATS